MPCAAGVRCKLPGQTPGPPFYTIHKCRKSRGYLHGICGEKGPIEDDDCKRVCEGHCLPESQRRAEEGSKDARPSDDNSQTNCVPGASDDTTGDKPGAPSKKAVGGQKLSNLSLNLKYDVLEFLQRNKKVKISAVAEKLGIADRTVRRIRQDEDKINERLDARPGCGTAKSLKGPTSPEVLAAHFFSLFSIHFTMKAGMLRTTCTYTS